jgi:undecaprenyl-diphosphatase
VWRLWKAPHEDLGAVVNEALLPGLVGMVICFLAGLVALRFLSAVLERGRWRYFGYYCIFASLAVLALWMLGF